MWRSVLVVVLGLWGDVAQAQTAWTRRLGAEPGHPAHSVYHMLVDGEGLLWLSTENGVYSYDGVVFEALNAPELRGALVLLFQEDSVHNKLWMAAHGGAVFCLDHATGRVRSFGAPPIQESTLITKARTLLPRADGSVIVGYDSGQGAYVLDTDGTWSAMELPDKKDGLFLWTVPEGLVGCSRWVVRPDTVQVYTRLAGEVPFHASVEGVSDGWHTYQKWLGRRRGLPVFAIGERVCWWQPDGTLRSESYTRYVMRLFEDHAGRVWTLEYLGQVRCYAPDGTPLNVRLPQLGGMHATDIAEDHQGGIWISTLGNGLFRALPFVVNVLRQDDPSAPGFTCMAGAPEGGLFTGSLLGQVVQWSANMEEVGRWSLTPTSAAVEVKGVQWCQQHQAAEASGPRVLAKVQGGHMEVTHTDRSYAAYAYRQVHLGGDSLLVLNPNGLMLLPQGPTGALQVLRRGGRFFQATWQQDTLWLASTLGIMALDGQRNLHGPLVVGHCSDLVEWQGGLVAALRDSGLVHRDASGRWERWLPHPWAEHTSGLDVDDEGGLWLATAEGVLGLDATGKVVWRSDRITGSSLGRADDVVVQPDAVWTIGHRAIHRLARQVEAPLHRVPIPRFTRCMASGRELPAGQLVPLFASERDVSLNFRVALPGRMGEERYRVRLDDGDWSELHTSRIDLFNLGAGVQRVEVQASLGGGEWGPSGLLHLHVAPYLHETWWARLALLALVLLALLAFQRWREATLRRRLAVDRSLFEMQLQALTARLEPHFVFNALNGIQSYLAQHDREAGMRYLARFSRLMRGLLEAGQAKAISLQQEVELLEHYCSLEAMRFDPPFTWRIQVDPALDPHSTHLHPYLVQPYVENAVRHGLWHADRTDRQLEISFAPGDKGLLRCTITDNGVGRAEAARRAGARDRNPTGLATNADRLRLLGSARGHATGHVSIEDRMDEQGEPVGTQVTLLLPLTKADERQTERKDDVDGNEA